MNEPRFPDTPFEIKGLRGQYTKIEALYDYTGDRCRCPVCGGLGVPWLGWFSCEDCDAKACIKTGEVIMPILPMPAKRSGCLI